MTLDVHYLWMISSCQTAINAKQSHHFCIQLIVKFSALVGHYHLRKAHPHENLLTQIINLQTFHHVNINYKES